MPSSRSYARAFAIARPARSAIRISRLSSSAVQRRDEQRLSSTTPAISSPTGSGAAMTARGCSDASAASSPSEKSASVIGRPSSRTGASASVSGTGSPARSDAKPLAAPTRSRDAVVVAAQQDAREVRPEVLADPLDERCEHLLECERPERRLGHALELRERLRDRLGLSARGALDRRAAPVGHVEHLPDQVQGPVVGVDRKRHAHERVAQLAVAAREAHLGLMRALGAPRRAEPPPPARAAGRRDGRSRRAAASATARARARASRRAPR